MEPVALFEEATTWVGNKVRSVTEQLRARTPCEAWDVETLLNHMLDAMRYFTAIANGEDAQLDVSNPPALIGSDPGATYHEYRAAALEAFRSAAPERVKFVPIAFCDQLIHGWDLAKATGQDTTMPDGLADAAWAVIGGKISDERPPGGGFKTAISVASNVPVQDKLLAYTGRNP